MSRRKITMQKQIEILRLRHDCGLSVRDIAAAVQVSKSTVQKVLKTAQTLNLKWPLDQPIDEQQWVQVYTGPTPNSDDQYQVDYAQVREELRRKGVTQKLLWQEHCHSGYPLSYSQFTRDYTTWRQSQKLSMRQVHEPGDKAFVDFSGLTVPVAERKAEIFVGALGASQYTFVIAVWSQSLPDWLHCCSTMLKFFGGVPNFIVPDNLKSGVKNACRYDPEVNPIFAQWSTHYDTVILPTRPKKPKDKAIAENAVQQTQRRILAPLRDRRYQGLSQLNNDITPLLKKLNAAPFSNRPGSRRDAFKTLDYPALKPLNWLDFEPADSKTATVGFNYHVCYLGHWYSVPYEYRGLKVVVQATCKTVTVFYQQRQIAHHLRAKLNDRCTTTVDAHMPKAHQEISQWTPKTLKSWARKIGPHCLVWVRDRLNEVKHPQQVSRRCLGVLRLSEIYGNTRLNEACRLANQYGLDRYRHLKDMLVNDGDRTASEQLTLNLPQQHENVRGAKHFN